MQAAIQALDKTKIQMLEDRKFTFFTSVALSLRHRFTDEVPTAAVNGVEVMYNPDYFMAQSPAVRKSISLHEVSHVVLRHIGREGERDHQKWNRAGDYCINDMLYLAGCTLGDRWLWDRKYRGLSTDEIYDLLPDEPEPGFVMDILPSPMTKEKADKFLDGVLVKAAILAKATAEGWGMVPQDIQNYVTNLTNPKLPWHALVRRYYRSVGKTEHTFRRPNRRYFPEYVLSTQHAEKLGTAAVFTDVSLSVTQKQTEHFISETLGLIKSLHPDCIKFGQFDTRIICIDDVKTEQELKEIKFIKGGGTYITPVIDWINENKPAVAIIFTDGDFASYPGTCKVPIIWIIDKNPTFTCKFGRIVHFDAPE